MNCNHFKRFCSLGNWWRRYLWRRVEYRARRYIAHSSHCAFLLSLGWKLKAFHSPGRSKRSSDSRHSSLRKRDRILLKIGSGKIDHLIFLLFNFSLRNFNQFFSLRSFFIHRSVISFQASSRRKANRFSRNFCAPFASALDTSACRLRWRRVLDVK